jgi:hypothetical protein
MPEYISLDTLEQRERFRMRLERRVLDGKHCTVTFALPDVTSSTAAQTAALWRWCEQIADTLNNAGLDMVAVLDSSVEMTWTKSAVMDKMVRSIIKAKTGKDSTRGLKKDVLEDVIQTLHRYIATKGVALPPFPSRHPDV